MIDQDETDKRRQADEAEALRLERITYHEEQAERLSAVFTALIRHHKNQAAALKR